jgi:putative nucleotidyltransferase with HDIG domain
VQISGPPVDSSSVAATEQVCRRNRLIAIIEKGLPPFPHTVAELTAILSGPSADMKKAAKLVRSDANLTAHVLRICNAPLFGLRSRVLSVEQAATLLGTERLRSVAMTSSLVDLAAQGLPKDQVSLFWKHSFLAAKLSEHLAEYRGYSEKEQAYIAGLLHDIGQIPHWMLVAEEKLQHGADLPKNWTDNTAVEREHFGMDHCEVGSRMAQSWNFLPSFVDVLASHHEIADAQHDPYLVQIVAGVEHFLIAKEESVASADAERSEGQPSTAEIPAVTERTCQPFDEADWQAIAENLNDEYNRLLPQVEGGLASILG